MSDSTLQRVLEFMYRGSTTIRHEELGAFIEACRTFQIDELVNAQIKEDTDEIVKIDDEIQGKELDLSQNGPSRNSNHKPSSRTTFPEPRETFVPKLIAAPQQAHINPALMSHPFAGAFDTAFFNNALAMRTNPQSYLGAQLSSPSRASIPSQALPRQSPIKSVAGSPKLRSDESFRCDPSSVVTAASIRRISNSPEDSTNSNTSLDLTKPSNANSPLSRININVTAAAFASQMEQYMPHFKPPIRVSQNVLKRSRSKSPEPVDVRVRDDSHDREEEISNRYSTGHSPRSGKQNSSGGSSSDHNNYSDEDSGPENGDQDGIPRGRRSVSPGPSTSTPKVTEAFIQNKTGKY